MLQVGLKFYGDNNVFKAKKSLDSGTAMIQDKLNKKMAIIKCKK